MRTPVVAVIFFILGFAVNGYLVSRGIHVTGQPGAIMQAVGSRAYAGKDVTVTYEHNAFNPNSVTIEVGRYLTIVNRSDSLMWLTSADARFNTPRGYGRDEQVRVRMDREGTVTVGNKLNLGTTVTVTVAK